MEWNVILMNNGRLEWYNIFQNRWMHEWELKWLRGEETIEGFWREAKYAFWSKCEYEVVIREWPSGSYAPGEGNKVPLGDKERKIDVYQQLKGQKDRVEEYLIAMRSGSCAPRADAKASEEVE